MRQSFWESLIRFVLIKPYRCLHCHRRFFRLAPLVAVQGYLAKRRLQHEAAGHREIQNRNSENDGVIRTQAPILWKVLCNWLANQCQDFQAGNGSEALRLLATRENEVTILRVATGAVLKIVCDQSDTDSPQGITYQLNDGSPFRYGFQRTTGSTVVLLGPDGLQHSISGFGVLVLKVLVAGDGKLPLPPKDSGVAWPHPHPAHTD